MIFSFCCNYYEVFHHWCCLFSVSFTGITGGRLLATQANSWYRKSPKIPTVKEMSSLRKTLGGLFGGGTGRAPQWTLVWCVEEFVSVPPASTNTGTHMIPGVKFNILTCHRNNLTSKVCCTFTFIIHILTTQCYANTAAARPVRTIMWFTVLH